tara:strand:+ start:1716 stop:1976 length:261 start_codon:yes stop_codon:yes gene_type:complete
MALCPDGATAFAELKELIALGADDVDTVEVFQRFADSGLPILCVDRDIGLAETANGTVFTYKLADELQICLTALRARHLDTVDISN